MLHGSKERVSDHTTLFRPNRSIRVKFQVREILGNEKKNGNCFAIQILISILVCFRKYMRYALINVHGDNIRRNLANFSKISTQPIKSQLQPV